MGFWWYTFSSNAYNRFTAVSFQFSRIGNDPRATQLLIDLDDDPDIREYIDVLPVEFGPEFEFDKWFVVCHNLLFSHFIDLKRPPH